MQTEALHSRSALAPGIYCSAATFILMAGALLFLLSLTFLFPLQAAHPGTDVPPGHNRETS
ncbi:MAG TPA: hypothetical protein VKP66_17325 [Steroidobacteraceae bacterium]|nr:hypothetical protein [Steroidobacteraceae bacterium]